MAVNKKLLKWKRIRDEYFKNGFNGREAYLKVNPAVKASTAGTEFNKLLNNPEFEKLIHEKYKKAVDISTITHQKMLNELISFAFSDITTAISLSPQEVKELPEEIRRLITAFDHKKVTTGTGKDKVVTESVKLKFVSKERAFDMIAKHIGFFGEHNFQKSGTLTPDERKALIAKYQLKIKGTKY